MFVMRDYHDKILGLIVFTTILFGFALAPMNFSNSFDLSNSNIFGLLIHSPRVSTGILTIENNSPINNLSPKTTVGRVGLVINKSPKTNIEYRENIESLSNISNETTANILSPPTNILIQIFDKSDSGIYNLIFSEVDTKNAFYIDFDGDKDLDIITYGDENNYVYINQLNEFDLSDSNLGTKQDYFISLPMFNDEEIYNKHTKIILPYDFNKDGLIDYFVGNYNGNNYIYYSIKKINKDTINLILTQEDSNTLESLKDYFNKKLIFSGRYIRSANLLDINDDGYKDLIIANYNQPNQIFLNKKDSFDELNGNTLDLKPQGDYDVDVDIFDVNSDGKKDVLFTTNQGVYVFYNEYDGKNLNNIFNLNNFYKLDIKNSNNLLISDFNNDNKKDFLISVYGGKNQYYLYEDNQFLLYSLDGFSANNKNIISYGSLFMNIVYNDVPYILDINNQITSKQQISYNKDYYTSGLIEDFNNDGKLDLFLSSNKKDRLLFSIFQ